MKYNKRFDQLDLEHLNLFGISILDSYVYTSKDLSDMERFSEPQPNNASASVERQVPCEFCSARPHYIPLCRRLWKLPVSAQYVRYGVVT